MAQLLAYHRGKESIGLVRWRCIYGEQSIVGRSQGSSPGGTVVSADHGAGASSSGGEGDADDADDGESVGLAQKLLPVM
jgi:hypothetical protein